MPVRKPYDPVSIITPAWKANEFIDDYLESFVNITNSYKIEYEVIIGVDGCQETKDKFLSLQLPDFIKVYWFEHNYGSYIVRNTLVNNYSKNPYLMFFDMDDTFLSNYIDSNVEIRMFNDLVLQRPLYKKTITHFGSPSLWRDVWSRLGGFQPWKCEADTELIKRAKQMSFKRESVLRPNFYKREHEHQITKMEKTGMNSSLRKSYRNLVGYYKDRIDPITASCERII